MSAGAVPGYGALQTALCVVAVGDPVAYRAPEDSVALHVLATVEFLMLPVILISALLYGWSHQRRARRPRRPGWALIGSAALVPVSMAATNYWPHGLLLPIATGISVLAVAAAAGATVDQPGRAEDEPSP